MTHRSTAGELGEAGSCARGHESVLGLLLPGEQLPYAHAGCVPTAGAAVDQYTHAYLAADPAPVRQLLLDALWLRSMDVDDARVVHTIVVDSIRSVAGDSEPSPDRVLRADVLVRIDSASARRLRGRWTRGWHDTGRL